MEFKGTIEFVFDRPEGAAEFGQKFHVGTDVWPEEYDLGDYPWDTFRVTEADIQDDAATLKLEFTVQNTRGIPADEFVEAVKEDFDALSGVDVPGNWYIDRAVATRINQGGRRRKTRKTRKSKKVKKTRRH